ncbi:MAG: type II toxin-antitoxin system RelE/ParE family toxin [Leptolyngbyaceae bacterium]|nr:type II toxin-antitoxin system RelE/ParE family toxin [Leptolyngbyaceae bacterium]
MKSTLVSKLKLIDSLAENPRPRDALKLKGSENSYRIRVGDYRICYEVKDKELIVILFHCMHPRDIYRK